MTLRVALSALTLVPGISGGSESYLRHLCRALAEVGENDYSVFAPGIAPDAGEPLRTEVVRNYAAAWTIPKRLRAMTVASLAPGRFGREIFASSPDVIHFPLTIHVPRVRKRVALVTTVHDVQHEFFPEFFSKGELLFRRVTYPDAIRRSDCVITISEHARQAIIEKYRVDASRVRCIHLGVDTGRFHQGNERRENFLFYPANRWPHKNHDRLFEAFALIRTVRPEMSLVLTGVGHDERALPPGVTTLGHVPAAKVPELYRTADALVFPSLYEGFGLPPLEAMASGCPVACSNAGPLPEICGDAAELFDPMSPEAIAAAVLRVVDAPDEYVRRGLARVAHFSWSETARQHDAVYRDVSV